MEEFLKILNFLIPQVFYFMIPLLVVALGGLFSERSGIVNIALEGIMIIGAFAGTTFIHYMEQTEFFGKGREQLLLICALIVAAIAGAIIAVPHAYASINMKADQVISGTAINMFAPAFTVFVIRILMGDTGNMSFKTSFMIKKVPVLGDIPIIGNWFFHKAFITTLVGLIILVISWFVLYKTRFGLRMRACGEHPQAADSVGISVSKMRYAGTIISGVLGGIGGLAFVLPASKEFGGDVCGYGFLALAVLIFGQWRPWKIFGAALFFGFMKAFSASQTIFSIWDASSFLTAVPNYFFKIIPFVATIIILALSSKKSRAPKAEGIPYDKGAR